MVGFSREYMEREYMERERVRSDQLNFREQSRLRLKIVDRFEYVDDIYVCLENSMDNFGGEGLFATAALFSDIYVEVSEWYEAFKKVAKNDDLVGTYESVKHKLSIMKDRVNQEIRQRDEYSLRASGDENGWFW